MICCYFLHIGQFDDAADALEYHAQKRTTNSKGVTIPSQRRYVDYYAQLMNIDKPYKKVKMNVSESELSIQELYYNILIVYSQICEIRIFNLPLPSFMGVSATISYSIVVGGEKVSREIVGTKKAIEIHQII
jgi:hypothetical protein